jgi:3-phosphoshikimate 1-carboxyvinyltransferase
MRRVIEIHPLNESRTGVTTEISVPGSKSITNRALILAVLGHGRSELRHALWSEDTQVMVDCLRRLGFQIEIAPDETESGNRHITIEGQGGQVPNRGASAQPLELFVANAGTAARFLAALVCLGNGVYRLSGIERMHQRPQGALFKSLRQLGYRVKSPNDRLPAVIHGEGPKAGKCVVSIEESSQFASALLLSGVVGGWKIGVEGENSEESPYVSMTSELIKQFPRKGGRFEIEPDASSASYIWAANWLLKAHGARISVAGWMKTSLQIDARFPEVLSVFPKSISRKDELGDSIMTAIVLAPFAREPRQFTGLGRLRVQESERVFALKTELQKCGARVEESGDTLTVYPAKLHGAAIHTYNDHRIAMCFGTLALKVPGIKIENPDCVKKTFPNFFQKFAAPPPHGLGVRIDDGETGQELSIEDLNAE